MEKTTMIIPFQTGTVFAGPSKMQVIMAAFNIIKVIMPNDPFHKFKALLAESLAEIPDPVSQDALLYITEEIKNGELYDYRIFFVGEDRALLIIIDDECLYDIGWCSMRQCQNSDKWEAILNSTFPIN